MASPIDILAGQYNLSPAAVAGLAQYANPLRYPNGELINPPAAAAAPDVSPPIVDGTARWPNGELRTASDPPPVSTPPDAAPASTLNYSPNLPQVSQAQPYVAPIKPGEPGSSVKIVKNPNRVDSPYGGFDPDAPTVAPIVQVSKGGMQPYTVGGQVHRGQTEGQIKPLRDQGEVVLDAEGRAMRSHQVLAQQDAEKDVAYKATYAEEMRNYADRAKLNEENRHAFIEDQTKRLNTFTGRIAATEDPDQIWGTGSAAVLAKIGAAIAVGGGAFGAAFTHGPNFAKDIIDGEMNTRIKAMRESTANARSGFDAQSNLYAKGLAEFKDRDLANLATRLNMTNATLAEIDRAAAKGGLTEKQNADFQTLRANYEKEKLEMMGRWNALTTSHYVDTFQDKYAPPQYAGGGPVKGKKKGHGEGGPEDLALVPGYGQAQSPHDARELNKEISLNTQVQNKINRIRELQELAKKESSFNLGALNGTDKLAEYENEIQQLTLESVERTMKLRGIRNQDPEVTANVAQSLGLKDAWKLRGKTDAQISMRQHAIDVANEQIGQNNETETRQFGVADGGAVYETDPVTGKPRQVVKLTGRTAQPLTRNRNVDNVADKVVPAYDGED